jgi:hypothetical protein
MVRSARARCQTADNSHLGLLGRARDQLVAK